MNEIGNEKETKKKRRKTADRFVGRRDGPHQTFPCLVRSISSTQNIEIPFRLPFVLVWLVARSPVVGNDTKPGEKTR